MCDCAIWDILDRVPKWVCPLRGDGPPHEEITWGQRKPSLSTQPPDGIHHNPFRSALLVLGKTNDHLHKRSYSAGLQASVTTPWVLLN